MDLRVSTLSKTGGREVNEDAYGVWSAAGSCFCVLADGVGGHGSGDQASKLAVRHTLEYFRLHPRCTESAVVRALSAANAAIINEQEREDRFRRMRSTAVVLAIDTVSGLAAWGHVGDSRLYYFSRRSLVEQTRDHSLLQQMVDTGCMTMAELRRSPERSKLLTALGERNAFSPSVSSLHLPLQLGDCFLLCTDGFWEYVEEAEMERGLADTASTEDWLRFMEALVIQRGGPRQDNYSAIAVQCSVN